MALKLGKLDAICARLKKTSAVDVKATTQNGVTDATEATEGHTKVEDVKATTTTNNNEETATDLNETPSNDATTSGASEGATLDSQEPDDEESSVQEAQSVPVSTSTPTPLTTSTPSKQSNGSSGRRKSRKAAKPRIFSQIQERFDTDLYEEEDLDEEDSVKGFGFDDQESSYASVLATEEDVSLQATEEEDESVDKDTFNTHVHAAAGTVYSTGGSMHEGVKKPTLPQALAGQYSLIQPGSSHHAQILDASLDSSTELSADISGLPLDLSTSKTSDDSGSEPVTAESAVRSGFVHSNTADSLHKSSAVNMSPLAVAHTAVAHNAEAKVLADYAKNTMNELLSIYGFGGAGLLEGVAQKHFVNLASLKAATLLDASTKIPAKPIERIATRLLNGGRPVVHKDVGTSANNLKLEGNRPRLPPVSIAPKPTGQYPRPIGTETTTDTPTALSGARPSHGDPIASVIAEEKPVTATTVKHDTNQLKLKLQNSLKGSSSLKHSGSSGITPQKLSSSDYNKYIKKFHNGVECGGSHCRDLGYKDHYHCHDCNFKVFVKKEEMVRHYKWHKKRDESLQHGFMRYSPMDDCGAKYGPCTHNGRQTHYHCVQSGCDKVYISTSDVQMHANYHRKDSAIIQEGFQRFRATEDCGTTTCSFYGQRTTHFHCRRANCNFTFKNKADMEKHKSYHQKDEILGRDGFKKFMKYEHCTFAGCRFSKISNHIHCIRQGCSYVLHSTAQLYSHKRKHERREFESLYRTFRQAQRPAGLPAQGIASVQTGTVQAAAVRQLTPAIAKLPIVTSNPVQAIGEPMVAHRVVAGQPVVAGQVIEPAVSGQLVQPIAVPIQLGTTTAAMLPRSAAAALIVASKSMSELTKQTTVITIPVTVTTPSQTNTLTPSQTSAVAAKNLDLTTAELATTTSIKSLVHAAFGTESADGCMNEGVNQPKSIKQEPMSDMDDSDSDTGSSKTKSTGTLTLPFNIATKLELKEEKLNDSLTLSIPGESSAAIKEEVTTPSVKTMADASIEVNTSTAGKMVALIPRMRRVGAPEKRERDETWKNYLIRYTANDPCNSRCQLLYKDHYHCKIQGCQVLFRSKDGVREHAKFHDLQDRITPMVYDKYELLQACVENCQHSLKEIHYHCNWTGCNHVIPDSGPTFARLEHYRIHEYAKAAAGKNYRVTGGQTSRVEDSLSQRRRGRPPKYPRLDVPLVPKVDLSVSEITESTQKFADGEMVDEDSKVVNGFRKFEEAEACPDDQCMYHDQVHYHCGRPRCHTATDRVDVLNLHAKDFHSFVTILENFEFFDRNVNCRRAHCHNNQVNRHYHCMRPRCDYSFVRHSTMAQHDKKHVASEALGVVEANATSVTFTSTTPSPVQTTPVSSSTRVNAPIQWLKRPDGKAYIPIIPALDPQNKNVVKAAGTFYPLSGLPGAMSLNPATMGLTAVSGITLSLPINMVTATIPVMAQTQMTTALSVSSMVPIFTTGNVVSAAAVTTANNAPPLTVLLQQKSGNGVPQPSWSAMRQSMHFSLQASCGRPFCKLKKKDHYHCLECNQAFSDPARLRGHISKHGVKFKKMNQAACTINSIALAAACTINPIALAAAGTVNPLAHAATGAVNSTGGGLPRGVKPKPVPVNFLNVSETPLEMGLDLSTSKAKEEDSLDEHEEQEEMEADDLCIVSEDQGLEDDDDDSMSLSLNQSVSSISNILPREELDPSSPSMDASEYNEEGVLVIDEEIHDDSLSSSLQHSLNSSMDGRDYSMDGRDYSVNGEKEEEEDFEGPDNVSEISAKETSLASPTSSATAARRSSRKRTATVHADFINSDDAALAKQMKLKLSGPIPSTVIPKVIIPAKSSSTTTSRSAAVAHSRQIPEGFTRFHCSMDCGYTRCAYRQTVTHFHCLRTECGYGFSDKSRIIQHRLRHERIDKLMGDDFQQFRATVSCERPDCEFEEKASHFHCGKCAFVCADSSKVLAHRKYHTKMDNISNNGFRKFTGSEDCRMPMCAYCRKQTHYHCTQDGCNHAVLGPAQMAPHKLKHASRDV